MATADDLRRLADESRVRLACAQDLREQNAVIARQSRRRLESSRRLLERGSPTWQV